MSCSVELSMIFFVTSGQVSKEEIYEIKYGDIAVM